MLAACACGHFGPGTNSIVMRSLFVESVAAVPPNPPSDPDAPRAARRLTARFRVTSLLAPLRGNIRSMKVATGTVIDGKVVVEGESLAEGTKVTVVVREDDESFDLTPEEEAELLASIAEIERGEYITAEELLERLRRFG